MLIMCFGVMGELRVELRGDIILLLSFNIVNIVNYSNLLKYFNIFQIKYLISYYLFDSQLIIDVINIHN